MRNSRLDSYVIKETIGEGATSKVKLVEDKETKQVFAMKIIRPRPEIQKQIDREIEILQTIAVHPHLVNLREVIKTADNTKIYLVLDYIRNGDLEARLEEDGPLDECEARFFFRQLISAIRYLHSLHITHRDLKLENLLIDDDGNLRLSDFGLSIVQQTDLSTHCGTPYYVAPEIFFNARYDGPPADVWSCGIVLFILLTGGFPFEGRDFDELGHKIMKGKINYPPYLSAELVDLLQHILNVDPTQRFTVEDIMAHKWFNASGSSAPLTPTDFNAFDDLIIDLDDATNTNSNNVLGSKVGSKVLGNNVLGNNVLGSKVLENKQVSQFPVNIDDKDSDSTDDVEEEEEENNDSIIPPNLQFRPNNSVVRIPVQIQEQTQPQRLSSASSETADANVNSEAENENHKTDVSEDSKGKNDGDEKNDKMKKKSKKDMKKKHTRKNVFEIEKKQDDAFQEVTSFLSHHKAKLYESNSQADGDEKIVASMKFLFTRVKFAIELGQTENGQTEIVVTRKSGSKFNFNRVLKSMKAKFAHL